MVTITIFSQYDRLRFNCYVQAFKTRDIKIVVVCSGDARMFSQNDYVYYTGYFHLENKYFVDTLCHPYQQNGNTTVF